MRFKIEREYDSVKKGFRAIALNTLIYMVYRSNKNTVVYMVHMINTHNSNNLIGDVLELEPIDLIEDQFVSKLKYKVWKKTLTWESLANHIEIYLEYSERKKSYGVSDLVSVNNPWFRELYTSYTNRPAVYWSTSGFSDPSK